MTISPEKKQSTISEYRQNPQDTGSPDIQIAIMTARINALTEHLKLHKHDFHSRRGLLMLVGKRRRLLNYVKRIDVERYQKLLQRLSLRR